MVGTSKIKLTSHMSALLGHDADNASVDDGGDDDDDDDGGVVIMIIMMFIRMVSYNVDVGGNEEEYWE